MNRFFLPLAFLLLCCAAHAQSLTGKWRGHLTQEPLILYSDFYYEMELVQTGNTVTGTAHIYADENYALMPLSGTFDGKNFTFQERFPDDLKIRTGFEWCIKSGTLSYSEKNGQAFLEGPWAGKSTGGDCNPGQVFLQRPIDKPKTIDSTTVVRKDSTVDNSKIVINSGKVKQVFDRQPKTGRPINVTKGATIKIRISDNAKVDGDSITFYYNDKLLLEHFELGKSEKTLTLKLDKNADTHALILYADNLGTIPPNTAFIEIDDGVSKQHMSMESDLDRCDIIYLIPR